MATFSEYISNLSLTVTGTDSPVAVSEDALTVVSSSYNQVYETSSTSPVRSPDIGLPYLSADDLVAGSTWLIYYQASVGNQSNSVPSTCYLVDVPVATRPSGASDLAGVEVECTGTGTPYAMNGTLLCGMLEYSPDGTKNIEFSFKNLATGGLCSVTGVSLVAIRVDDKLTKSATGGDYWHDAQSSFSTVQTNSTTVASTIHVTNYTPDSTDDFWLIVSGESLDMPISELVTMWVEVDGVQILTPWVKNSADSRDSHCFFLSKKLSLSGGVPHEIRLLGRKQSGTGLASFKRGRITLLKLSSFGSHTYLSLQQPSVTTEYPSRQEIISGTFTPSSSGENVLVIANGAVSHSPGAAAAITGHVTNMTATGELVDFSGFAHPSSTAEVVAMTCGGSEVVNAQQVYSYQLSSQSGFGASNPLVGKTLWPHTLMMLGLSTNPTPGVVMLSASDSIGRDNMLDSPSGTYDGDPISSPMNGYDSIGLANISDSGSASIVYEGVIPVAHPRMWLNDNIGGGWANRLAYLQAHTSGTRWTTLLNYIDRSPAHYALAYKMTGTTSYRDSALARIDTILSNASINMSSSGVTYRETMRTFALTYDWLHDELGSVRKQKMQDYMLGAVFAFMNDKHPDAAAVTHTGGDPSPNGWDKGNNFYVAYTMMCAYAAIALYHEQPLDWGWPPGSSTRRQFILPRHHTQGGPLFTDLYEYTIDRIDQATDPSNPVWTRQGFGSFIGGGWIEGSEYGRGVGRAMMETLLMLRNAAGQPYFDNFGFASDIVQYMYYETQPGSTAQICLGEATINEYITVHTYNRLEMLFCVGGLLGTQVGKWGQYWLDNIFTDETSANAHDFTDREMLMYCEDFAEENAYLSLGLGWFSIGNGFLNSRNVWSSTGTSATISAVHFAQGHQHNDQGHIQIFKGGPGGRLGGWLLGEPQGLATGGISGDPWHTKFHNTYLWVPSNYPGGWMQATGIQLRREPGFENAVNAEITRHKIDSDYVYGSVDMNNSYWSLLSPADQESSIGDPITDVAQREFFHHHATNFVVSYDRMRVISPFTTDGGEFHAHWHYAADPVANGTDTVEIRTSSGVMFRKYVIHDGVSPTYSDLNSPPGFTVQCFREVITLPLATSLESVFKKYGRLCTTFEVGETTQSAPTTTRAIKYQSALGFDQTSMEGVSIQATPFVHVVFSAEEDGSTPNHALAPVGISYYVVKGGSSDKHYVHNLVPNQYYHVTETDLNGTYFRYDFTPTTSSTLRANDAGVLEFAALDIGSQVDFLVIGSESINTGNISETPARTVSWLSDGSDDELAVTDTGVMVYDGVQVTPTIIVDSYEYITNDKISDAGYRIGDFLKSDILTMTDGGSLSYTPPFVPPPAYTEKKIFRGNVAFYPNGDRGLAYFTVEPSDSNYSDVLADEDDNTFIKTWPTIAGIITISHAIVSVELDDPAGFNGTIRTIKFKARIRSSDIGGVGNPGLLIQLNKDSASGELVAISYIEVPSVTTAQVVEIESTPIPVSITTDNMARCVLTARPAASVYSETYSMEISSMWVETTGSGSEKVIK
ncbi:MAG: hypothetical protein OEV86_12955 [Candidatus Krumholzibacteria bacterium]|nr:hypothetical protein [Candidatus Krumholzibacteria bacterium]